MLQAIYAFLVVRSDGAVVLQPDHGHHHLVILIAKTTNGPDINELTVRGYLENMYRLMLNR